MQEMCSPKMCTQLHLVDTHIDTSTATATDLHTGANLHPPPWPPLYPTVLIKAERLQKVGANNKATYYI